MKNLRLCRRKGREEDLSLTSRSRIDADILPRKDLIRDQGGGHYSLPSLKEERGELFVETHPSGEKKGKEIRAARGGGVNMKLLKESRHFVSYSGKKREGEKSDN